MPWLRNVVLDLVVTACILAATVFEQTWAGWIVVVYTPLMVVLKAVAFFTPDLGGGMKRGDEVPDLFYHLLYAVDAGLLLLHGWWWTGAGWILIWILSATRTMRRRRPG